jgi:hypothetical protein
MSEEWITFSEAVEIVRAHLGSSVGRSEAVTNAARASGEVRFQNPAAPVLLLADDGIVGMSLRPGAHDKAGVTADGKPIMHRTISTSMFQINKDDLLEWIGRHHTEAAPKPKSRPRKQIKRSRVASAIQALWPNGPLEQSVLPNALLCIKVQDWLKDDSKSQGVPAQVISDDTILRAAGRKRK